jgi:ATP-dependent Clp protease ATP-binding subunit ClpC
VDILFRELDERLSDEGMTVVRTDAATDFLVDHGYDERYGARPLKRAIQRYIEDPLSDRILMGEFTSGSEIEVDVDPDGEQLTFRVAAPSEA